MTDPLRDKLDVLTGVGMEPEVGNPVLIAEGVDGYRLTKSDLLKLNCITDGCEFYLDNDCILMRKIDPSANEKIDPAQLRIRTGNGMVEADGIPAGHRYALYNLSGIILAKRGVRWWDDPDSGQSLRNLYFSGSRGREENTSIRIGSFF